MYTYTSIIISVQDLPCQDGCRCHYDINQRANIFSCTGLNYTALPKVVPNLTQWINFRKTNMTHLCGIYNYLKRPDTIITYLNLEASEIDLICQDALDEILNNSNIQTLSLAKNKLKEIPIIFNSTTGRLQQLWLGGNPVRCDCNMLWLIPWLNSTQVSGKRLVQDYKDVICSGGQWDGTPVYILDKVRMGCYPRQVARWIIVVSSTIGSVVLISVVVILTIWWKRNALRWIIYKNFDRLIGNPDENEDLEGIEFDAFLSFW